MGCLGIALSEQAASPSPARIAEEIKRRINVAVWAYAYEMLDDPLTDDATFDRECRLVDLSINTGYDKMDEWFRANFQNFTGAWIHNHPELDKLKRVYNFKAGRR